MINRIELQLFYIWSELSAFARRCLHRIREATDRLDAIEMSELGPIGLR